MQIGSVHAFSMDMMYAVHEKESERRTYNLHKGVGNYILQLTWVQIYGVAGSKSCPAMIPLRWGLPMGGRGVLFGQ